MRQSFVTIIAILVSLSVNAQQVADSVANDTTAQNQTVATIPAADIVPAAVATPAETATPASTKTPAPIFRFGYVSYSDMLKAMPEYAKAMADIDSLKSLYDKEVATSEADINKRFAEYIEGQGTFPENILLKRQKELQMLINQSIAFKEEAQRMLTEAEAKIMQPLHTQLNSVLAKVGADRKYAFILNTDNNSCPFVDPQQGEDITDIVLQLIGAQ